MQGLLAARLDSLEPAERVLVQHAAVVGRTFWEGSLAMAGQSETAIREALQSLQEKDIIVPDVGVRLAGEREYSFKHVLIRDVAYGMLPKAVRARKHFDIGRFLEDRAGERTDEVVALLAEHFGRAAILANEGGMEGVDAEPIHRKALHYLEAAGDAAAALYSNPEAFEHYEAAQKIDCPHDPGAVARVIEKQGDVAFRMGRVGTAVDLWEKALEFHRQQEDLTRVADLHRKIGAGLWNRGERKQAIERYQKGINLLKDGPPCLELVHLYEEAASLYMHAGDNMLAIYASEKALRLAEKLQETRVASRAHGIFGRVFGRIGDTEKARENLERSVELARDSDDGETIRALLTLGHHLEVSEADYDGAGRRTARRSRSRSRWATCRPRWSCSPRSPRWPPTARPGTRSRWPPRRAPTSPSARAWSASSATRACCAACSPGARAAGRTPSSGAGARTSWRSRSAGPRSRSRRSTGWRARCATAATTPPRSPSSTTRSTSASAPA